MLSFIRVFDKSKLDFSLDIVTHLLVFAALCVCVRVCVFSCVTDLIVNYKCS